MINYKSHFINFSILLIFNILFWIFNIQKVNQSKNKFYSEINFIKPYILNNPQSLKSSENIPEKFKIIYLNELLKKLENSKDMLNPKLLPKIEKIKKNYNSYLLLEKKYINNLSELNIIKNKIYNKLPENIKNKIEKLIYNNLLEQEIFKYFKYEK